MRTDFSYHLVDVFTDTPLEGNALAVFPRADGLDRRTMQRIAREMNLSETTFVFPPEKGTAAPRVRIFTPTYEMEFAGHPTIGTAYVLRAEALVDPRAATFDLHENVGLVRVRVEGPEPSSLWLTTPPISFGDTFDRRACAAAVSLSEQDLLPDVPCRWLSAGNPNIYIPLRDSQAVDRAVVDSSALSALLRDRQERSCIFVFAPTPQGAYSRMFAPHLGIIEDPATGSATGPLAAFMMQYGLAPKGNGSRFVSVQGAKMGRRSILHVLIHGEQGAGGIEIGGYVTPVATGTLSL